MIIEPKLTYIAYRCPDCGEFVWGMVGQFAVKAGMVRLKCPCKKSELTVTATDDEKFRLSVPCMYCNSTHPYTVSQALFFGREKFLLNCSCTQMDCCFIGSEKQVQEEISRSQREFEQLCASLEVSPTWGANDTEASAAEDETPPASDPPSLPDAEVYHIVRFVVKELEAEGAIDCPCKGGHYETEINTDGIRVFCTDCGAEVTVRCDSLTDAGRFLECDGLTLKPQTP